MDVKLTGSENMIFMILIYDMFVKIWFELKVFSNQSLNI